ncbi:DUF805 domain-containing protein [Lewinella sp. 4G2]|uniref:DUF805 domain-containing protein n=1 Tax=Lewinella sp. 4G2 TaxID=1803372 RepID=UPI0007B4A53F|nr:DUF805 domain-containing protein [Lewinella sp. 4G2]OAV44857.1 hypothetical protein A3850_010295 [Lewinella sp. 4G2]
MIKYFTRAIGKFATFTGRSRRKEFWYFVLAVAIIKAILLNIHGSVIGNEKGLEKFLDLLFFVPSLAVAVRRLHDTGRSGWWMLMAPTGIGFIILLFWFAQDGDPHANEYGANPKGYDDGNGDDRTGRRRRKNKKYRKRLYKTLKEWEQDDDQLV